MKKQELYETQALQALRTLRKSILKGYGRQCKLYEPTCVVCIVWYALQTLESLWELEKKIVAKRFDRLKQ